MGAYLGAFRQAGFLRSLRRKGFRLLFDSTWGTRMLFSLLRQSSQSRVSALFWHESPVTPRLAAVCCPNLIRERSMVARQCALLVCAP